MNEGGRDGNVVKIACVLMGLFLGRNSVSNNLGPKEFEPSRFHRECKWAY